MMTLISLGINFIANAFASVCISFGTSGAQSTQSYCILNKPSRGLAGVKGKEGGLAGPYFTHFHKCIIIATTGRAMCQPAVTHNGKRRYRLIQASSPLLPTASWTFKVLLGTPTTIDELLGSNASGCVPQRLLSDFIGNGKS
jgi:hypothetical protein